MCLHLQAVAEGRIRRLIENVPPGSAKTKICGALFPAWIWLDRPSMGIMYITHKQALAANALSYNRLLLQSEWYDAQKGQKKWQIRDDENAKLTYKNTEMGHIQGHGMDSTITGYRADIIIIDDPIGAQDAESEGERELCFQKYNHEISSRLNQPEISKIVLVQQRLKADDLSGRLLADVEEGWEHLRIPQEYEGPNKGCECATCKNGVTSIGWKDPRRVGGEAMFPARFGPRYIASRKKDPEMWMAQDQQNPGSGVPGYAEAEWFGRCWIRQGEPLAPFMRGAFESKTAFVAERLDEKERWDNAFLVLDCSFKDERSSDNVAIGVFGKRGSRLYLLELIWKKMSFLDTLDELRALLTRRPDIRGKHIEDAANGPAIISALESEIPGIIREKHGNVPKTSRVKAVLTYWRAGNIRLPMHHPKRVEMVKEIKDFPHAKNDDFVDVLTYATKIAFVDGAVQGGWEKSMSKIQLLGNWG